MSIQGRRVLNNVLLRRVQRHQSITTLFHSHPIRAARPMPPPPQLSSAARVVQAKPLDLQAPPLPYAPAVEPPILPALTDPPRATPPLPLDSSAQELKAAASSKPTASDQPDPDWKRLKAIFRKHQEQEDQTAASITPREHLRDTPPSLEVPEPPKPAQIQRSSTVPEVVKPAQTLPLVQRKATPAVSSNKLVQPATPGVDNEIQSVDTNLPEMNPPRPSMKENPQPFLEKESYPPGSKAVLPGPIQTGTGEEPDIELTPRLNALPLESVWNVQMGEDAKPTEQPLSLSARSYRVPDFSVTSKALIQNAELETDSEPVAPREEYKPVDGTLEPQTDSRVDAEATPDPPSPVEILAPSRPRPVSLNPEPPSPVVQRQPQAAPASPEIHDERMIETAIGPLPADLWQLIGQKPPESQPLPPMSEPIHPAIQQAESAGPRNEALEHQPFSPGRLVEFPAVVQRQPAGPVASLPQEQPNPSLSSEPVLGAEPDVDELARKVYAKIRRRLSSEWERLRRS